MTKLLSVFLVGTLLAGCGGDDAAEIERLKAEKERLKAEKAKEAPVDEKPSAHPTAVKIESSPPDPVPSAPPPEPGKPFTIPGLSMEMLWVEPGTFTMGSSASEVGHLSDETEHTVTLTKGFFLGKYEVTQAEYQTVITGNTVGLSATPSQFSGNPNRPVEKVSWNDAQIFLTRLNDAEQTSGRLPTGWEYVLPTEAEWEYACRAGTTTTYSWGNSITTSDANYNNINQTRDVGQYAANPWGFFDMHGNIWEWTNDLYGNYPGGTVTDPTGATSGSSRIIRGGSWLHTGTLLRSALRVTRSPGTRNNNYLGFRVGFKAVR